MNGKDRKWQVLAGLGVMALVLVLVGGALLPRVASAQTDADTSAAADAETAIPEGGRTRGPGDELPGVPPPDMRGGDQEQYLADALGITVEELEAAKTATFEKAVDQALEQGLITEEQAAQLKERSANGSGGRFGGRGGFGIPGSDIDMDALLAEALGITVEELEAARAAAMDAALQARVEDGSITQEEADMLRARQALAEYLDGQGLMDRLRAVYEEMVSSAVAAGVVTQEQADAILEEPGLGLGGPGGRGGPGVGGPGGHGHGPDGFPGAPGMGAIGQQPDASASGGNL